MTFQVGATFPGVNQIRHARYTRTHGIEPDVALVEMIPQPNTIAAGGDLVFFGPQVVTIRACRVDYGSIRLTPDGHVASVRILDRRWAWRFGEISGRYNVPAPDGSVESGTFRTPQELATLLFQAMGETTADVSQLPNDVTIFVEWECANPAIELAKLCESLGCRVGLDLADFARVFRVGFGALLPTVEARGLSATFDPPEKPGSLHLCAGATLYQSRLRLQAVGQQLNGQVVPINQLTYTPPGGWEAVNPLGDWDAPEVAFAGEQARAIAVATVFRLYRVTSQADGSQIVPGLGAVPGIDSILPLNETLLETYEDLNGRIRPFPAFLDGKMILEGDSENLAETQIGTPLNMGFELFPHSGLVLLSRHAFRFVGNQTQPAELYLTTSYHVRRTKTSDRERFRLNRQISSNPTRPHVVRRFDMHETHRAVYSGDGQTVSNVVSNQPFVQQEAERALDAAQLDFQSNANAHAQYRGILQISTDGAIHQVGWDVHHRRGAMTFASRSSETEPGLPRQVEKQRGRAVSRYVEREQRDRSGSVLALVGGI